jgi:hypothetical protein
MLSGSFPSFALSNLATFSQTQTDATVPLTRKYGNMTTDNVTYLVISDWNQYYPIPRILPCNNIHTELVSTHNQLKNFPGAHESLNCKLGNIFRRRTIRFPSSTKYFL